MTTIRTQEGETGRANNNMRTLLLTLFITASYITLIFDKNGESEQFLLMIGIVLLPFLFLTGKKRVIKRIINIPVKGHRTAYKAN